MPSGSGPCEPLRRGQGLEHDEVTRLLARELSVSCGTPALDVLEQARGLAVGELGDELLRNAKDHGPAENLRELSSALRPGTKSARMSSSPTTAVTAPVGSLKNASVTGTA